MTQTRKQSAIETVAGVAIGFVVSLVASVLVFPLFGHAFTLGQNVGITIIFTVLSVARGYVVRRLFNRWGRP
jgi:membrane protease YdiL (CAAX protease family)